MNMGTGDRLEKFIKENRKELDCFEPPAGLWDNIETQLDENDLKRPRKEKVVKLKLVLRVAASVFLICAMACIYISRRNSTQVDMASIDPVLARQQSHYASLIEYKQEELTEIKNLEPQLYREFARELDKLQANYNNLQKELKNSPNQELTLQAMIKNMQIQTEMLNQQLQIIQQLKQLRNNSSNYSNENKGI